MKVTAKVEGLQELEKQLRELGGNNGIAGAKVLRSAMMSASLPMYKQMKASAPVSKDPTPRKRKGRGGESVIIRPGFLKHRVRRRSYVNRKGTGNRNISGNGVVKVRLGAFTPYALYVEMGTEKAPAQPFIRPAFDAGWRELLTRFRSLLEKRLLAAQRKLAQL